MSHPEAIGFSLRILYLCNFLLYTSLKGKRSEVALVEFEIAALDEGSELVAKIICILILVADLIRSDESQDTDL